MNIILIDDEPAMHLVIKRMLAKIDDVDVVAAFSDTLSAYKYVQTHEVDLILLDISMPKETGLEFAARLRAEGKQTRLVFLTSHKEYALDAFDVYAFDYLVKPVIREKLHRTMLRAVSEVAKVRPSDAPVVVSRSTGLTIRVFGGIELRSVGVGELRGKWKSRKSAELFAYLLLQKGRLCSRDRLIDVLFGTMPQKNAETYLNTTVYQLRKLLESFGRKEMLVSVNQQYALEIGADDEVDLTHFEVGSRQIFSASHFDVKKAVELEGLYAGMLFGERDFAWASGEAERLDRLYAAFVYRLCEELLRQGDAQTAADLSVKLITRNDLDEAPRLMLLEAMAMLKNRAGVVRQYEDYVQVLQRELGVNPSVELYSRYQQLLSELD